MCKLIVIDWLHSTYNIQHTEKLNKTDIPTERERERQNPEKRRRLIYPQRERKRGETQRSEEE